MNVKRKMTRMFGACILLMMTALAVYTLTFTAAAEERSNNSYSLVIAKIFDFEQPDYKGEQLPEEVKEQAKDQTYTFKITGTRRDGDKTVPVDITFTLPREGENGEKIWESKVYSSNGPFDVMVTELTDNIDITDKKGNHYNMAGSSPDTRVLVSSRKHEVRLRNNSILTLQRPADAGDEILWYRITNRPHDEHGTSSNYRQVDEIISLKAGEAEKKLTHLCAAVYTIEQIAAPDGYQLQMGERTEAVAAGDEGRFYINGTPGILTLTAGGTRGDGAIHYYRVDRTETEEGDDSEYKLRTVPIASGESYTMDNLPKGGYTVTEFTIDASVASRMTMPQTEERTRIGKSSGLTSGTTNNWKYMDLDYPDFDVDYIKVLTFGPLYNSSGGSLNTSTSYTTFRYGIASDDGTKITNIKTYSRSSGFTGNLTVTMTDAAKIKMNNCKRLYFTATGLKSSTAKKIGVSWIEYDEKETEKTFNKAGVSESITVDERRWLRIEAPALNDPDADGADQIAYYYTIRDTNGNLVAARDKNDVLIPNATDRDDTSVKLLPGTGMELMLPAGGSYTVDETIEGNTSVGFSMKIAGHPFGTTEAGKEIKVQVGGRRDVTISKPALGVHPDGSSDNRTYTFSVSGPGNFYKNVKIKAGESATVPLPKEGSYKILPQNDSLGVYDLYYSDSGAIYGTASGSTGTVTFTNSFSRGAYAYRYVHEYYVRDTDGDGNYTYTHEGNSQITTRMGREEDETYQALDLIMEPKYNENSYEHFSEAYGWVDPLTKTRSAQADQEDEFQTEVIGEENEASVSGTETPSGDSASDAGDSGEPGEPEAPEDGASDAGDSGEPGESEASEDDASDADDSEESGAPEGDAAADGEEQGAPKDDASDAGNSEEPGASEEEASDTVDSGGPEALKDDAADAAVSGEPEPLSEDVTDAADSGESETLAGDASDADAGEEPDESGTPTEDTKDADAGEAPGESGTPSEDVSDADAGEAPDEFETPPEDTEDADGSETPGESGTPTEDASDIDAGEAPDESETPSEDTEDADGNETPGESGTPSDASDTDAGEAPDESDTPSEGTENAGSSEGSGEPETSAEDTADADNKEEVEFSDSEEEVFSSKSVEVPKLRSEASYDDMGIIDKGMGLDSGDGTLNYAPVSEKDHIAVTEDASQIIILRYFRDRQPEGKYNVIHVYYLRDENGDHWEGISGVLPQNGELGVKYNGRRVDKVYDFQPADADRSYTYTWDGRPQYGVLENTGAADSENEFAGNGMVYRPNNAWTSVEGTEEGNQIIILRYYRELSKEGNYNIVHEYYTRKPDGNQAIEADVPVFGRAIGLLNEDSDEVSDEDSENGGADEDVSDAFIGTLDRSRNDGFVYDFEGNTKPEVLTDLLGTTHTAKEDDWKLTYEGNTYTYMDAGYGMKSDDDDYSCNPNQQWAASTEQGDDVIILRYVREAPEDPETPPDDPENPPDDPETPPDDPENPPNDPETPPDDPENPPEDPETPPDDPRKPLRDPERPSRNSHRSSESWENSAEITSLEEGVPSTGDNSRIVLWAVLAAGLLCGLTVWRFHFRKRTNP